MVPDSKLPDPTGDGGGAHRGGDIGSPAERKLLQAKKTFLVRNGRGSCDGIAASTERWSGSSQSPIGWDPALASK